MEHSGEEENKLNARAGLARDDIKVHMDAHNYGVRCEKEK